MRNACQIPERSDYTRPIPRGFKSSRDLAERRITDFWIKTLVMQLFRLPLFIISDRQETFFVNDFNVVFLLH